MGERGDLLSVLGIPYLRLIIPTRDNDALAMRAKARGICAPLMALQQQQLLACRSFPNPDRFIVRGGDDPSSIWAKRGARHHAVVPFQGNKQRAGRRIPNFGRMVGRCSDDSRSITVEIGRNSDGIAWPFQRERLLPGCHVPDGCRLSALNDGDARPVGGEGGAVERILESVNDHKFFP